MYHVSEEYLPLIIIPRMIESTAGMGEVSVVAFCVAPTPELCLLGKWGGLYIKEVELNIYQVVSPSGEVPYSPSSEECYDASIWQEYRYTREVSVSLLETVSSKALYKKAQSLYNVESLRKYAEMLKWGWN